MNRLCSNGQYQCPIKGGCEGFSMLPYMAISSGLLVHAKYELYCHAWKKKRKRSVNKKLGVNHGGTYHNTVFQEMNVDFCFDDYNSKVLFTHHYTW